MKNTPNHVGQKVGLGSPIGYSTNVCLVTGHERPLLTYC